MSQKTTFAVSRDHESNQSSKIDSHLHVWADKEEASQFPYFPGQEPSILGNAQFLIKNMEDAGVSGALIIQPINHKFDHSYVTSVIKKYPGKFLGCCLANPTSGEEGVKELIRLVEEEGYRAVRFNPYLWPQGEKMTNPLGKSLFKKAGELGIPVGFMCFKGLSLHIEEIEQLCDEFPSTTVILDHFGFCKPPKTEEEEEIWRRLLSLAKFPQVYVKASAFFRVSRESFPYQDTWPLLRNLVDEFGAKRVMWGSDFPFVTEECGYSNSWKIVDSSLFSEEELAFVMGGTIQSLFKGAWED